MLYSIVAFLFLLQPSWSSESSFLPFPINPKLGEDILILCKLIAREGHTFNGIVPDLIINNVESVDQHQFNFNQISDKLRDSRYHGDDIPDQNNLKLQGYIFISSLNISDLSINFTCFQEEEDGIISVVSLKLDDFVQNTPNPTYTQTEMFTPTMYNTHVSTPSNADTTTMTPNNVGNDDTPYWTPGKIAGMSIGIIAVMVISFLAGCVVVYLYFRSKNHENINISDLPGPTPTNQLGEPINIIKLNSNPGTSEIITIQNQESSDDDSSHLPLKRGHSSELQETN